MLDGSHVLRVPAIYKRRRFFNKNTSSIQAGIEAESETSFFDRLVGKRMGAAKKEDWSKHSLNGETASVQITPMEPEKESEASKDFQPESDDSKDRRDIRELQYALRDIMEAVEELQKLQVAARKLYNDTRGRGLDAKKQRINLPGHGEYCEAMDGQFLHVESLGVNKYLAMRHGLRRVPQGAIFIRNGQRCAVVVEGEESFAPPATDKIVWFVHSGPIDDYSVCILF